MTDKVSDIFENLKLNIFGSCRYQLIHRCVVNRRIKRLRQTYFVKLVDELKNVNRISVTTDF